MFKLNASSKSALADQRVSSNDSDSDSDSNSDGNSNSDNNSENEISFVCLFWLLVSYQKSRQLKSSLSQHYFEIY